ncbi:MAG TPA: DUF433 domain-containing protein [Candidatus Brocadiia bacterium]|nr:DUF433 domain-containing protein [Candidatus Brocadiales bacterium]
MATTIKTEHPHITHVEGTCGGRPIVNGTRTPVRAIVCYYKTGMSPEEIVTSLPHLSLAQVHDALSYYYDHQDEINKDIEENSEANVTKLYPPGKYTIK